MKTVLMFLFGFALLSTVSSRPIQDGQVSSWETLIQEASDSLLHNMEKAFIMQDAPTAKEIVGKIFTKNSDNRKELQKAWTGSFLGRDLFQERGGWIYANPNNPKQLQVVLAPHKPRQLAVSEPFRQGGGGNPSINLEGAATANAKPGWVLVANFHTHPLYGNPEPSTADLRNAKRRGVPGIIISHASIYIYGPDSRANFHPRGNPRAYPEDNNMDNFNPHDRSSVKQVGRNPLPRLALATVNLASILLDLIE